MACSFVSSSTGLVDDFRSCIRFSDDLLPRILSIENEVDDGCAPSDDDEDLETNSPLDDS